MRVVIKNSVFSGLQDNRGVGTYTRNLIKSLRDLNDGNEYLNDSPQQLENVDIIHYPYFDLFFLTLPIIKTIPTLVTIHDVIPLIFDKHYSPGLRGKIKLEMQKFALKSVKAVITDSNCSKQDIIRYLGIPAEKIYPIYLAADEKIKKQPEAGFKRMIKNYGIEQPYGLYVGDINYNKNIQGLLRAYRQVETESRLVIVSRAMGTDIQESRVIKKLIKEFDLKKKVKLLTDVPIDPPEIIASIYTGAEYYIQPSFYEGFGLPVLEAMKCGVPVISSSGGSLIEIVKDAAIIFDPKKTGTMVEALQRATNLKPAERSDLVMKGLNRSQKFSWVITAKKTSEVYQKIL